MEKANEDASSIFYRHLDTSRIGAIGHSAGGAAVEKLAVADTRVRVWIGMAGASYGSFGETPSGLGSKVPAQAGMLMYAEKDGIVPASSMKNAYNALTGPKRLLGIADSGHLVFADICTFGQNSGGIVGLAKKVGLPLPAQMVQLGTDGCSEAFAPIYTEQPLIKQALTAELRWQMGFDATQNALNGLNQAFGWRVLENTTAKTVSGALPWSVGQ
jgi:predicted dienelactone hydrolase